MKRIKIIGLAIVAVFAFSVAGVASASAHEFVASTTGALEAEALNNQVFTTAGGKVTCTKLKLEQPSEVTVLKAKEQTVKVVYEGCTAFLATAENIKAEYTFSAEGTVKIDKQITIKVPSIGCESIVPAQGPLSAITYANLTRNAHEGIEEKANVSAITSEGKGGCAYAKESKGTYTGNSFVWLKNGGSLKWE
jgi:hypothetical protein